MKAVVDTNVLIAANGRDTHATPNCSASSAQLLLRVQQEHILVEDTAGMVLSEYKVYCNFDGQPGAGDRFFLWYIRSRWSDRNVARVNIGENAAMVTGSLPAVLRKMDASDHKWIALFKVGDADAIYNATDGDWREHVEGGLFTATD